MPALKYAETTNFSRGSLDSASATAFRDNDVRLLLNARIQPDGTVEKRPGSQRLHATVLQADIGYGAVWFRPATGSEQIVAFCGDKAYKADGPSFSTWTEIATGLREDYYDFAVMRVGATTYLFAANGDTTIKRWDGSNWSTLPNAPSGVKYIEVFNARLWAAGHSGIIVQASKIADPTTWATPDGLLIQVITHGRGTSITGMGQIGPHLVVFDRESASTIDGYGEQTLIVAAGAQGLSGSVGCEAFRTIVNAGDSGLCWLSARGVEYYVPGAGIHLISSRVQRFMELIDRSVLAENRGLPTACYDEQRQEYHLALTHSGQRNDRTLVLKMPGVTSQSGQAAPSIDQPQGNADGLLFGSTSDGYLTTSASGSTMRTGNFGYAALAGTGQSGDLITEDADGYLTATLNDTLPACLFIAPVEGVGPVVHSLGYDGFVRKHYGVERDDVLHDGTGGVDVAFSLVTRAFLFGTTRVRKSVRVVHVAAIADAPASVDVRVRYRGRVTASRTITIPATDYDQPRRQRVMMSATGDEPQVELSTTDAVRIAAISVGCELLREPV